MALQGLSDARYTEYRPLERALTVVQEHLPLLAGGPVAIATGAFLLFDDVKDFGDFATEKHPSPIHHWQIGILLLLLGVVLLALALILITAKLLRGA